MTLCDDEHIQELNGEWRQTDAPTDVLAFPIGEMPPGYPAQVLGDVVISVDRAQDQAAERG